VYSGSYLDIFAIAIIAVLTIVLVLGIRESAGFNAAMVVIKVGIVLFVIIMGAFYVNPANWRPFAPYGWAGLSIFGHTVWGQTGPGGVPVGCWRAQLLFSLPILALIPCLHMQRKRVIHAFPW